MILNQNFWYGKLFSGKNLTLKLPSAFKAADFLLTDDKSLYMEHAKGLPSSFAKLSKESSGYRQKHCKCHFQSTICWRKTTFDIVTNHQQDCLPVLRCVQGRSEDKTCYHQQPALFCGCEDTVDMRTKSQWLEHNKLWNNIDGNCQGVGCVVKFCEIPHFSLILKVSNINFPLPIRILTYLSPVNKHQV